MLRDQTDEGGNQSFGFFKRDYSPRKTAVYLHNLTTILADREASTTPGQLNYSIPEQPATVHDLLLQKGDRTFVLVVWNQRVKGTDEVKITLGGTHAGVTVYDPTIGVDPVQTYGSVDSLSLPLSDHPMIIAIPAK